METTAMPRVVRSPSDGPGGYDQWSANIRARFLESAKLGPLFRTNAEGLNDAYLAALPPEWRQHHTCTACQRFLDAYGGLAVIDEQGRTHPALWATIDAVEPFWDAAAAMLRLVSRAKIIGVFLSSTETLGTPQTGIWNHLSASLPTGGTFTHALRSASQVEAEKLQDFITVERALSEFTLAMLEQALTLLETDSLYRSEKVLGPVKWLRDLQRDATASRQRTNLIWRAVALAPAGFCHPRSSMAGTLLEDIAASMDFNEVSRRFAAKMHPLQYQRPTAAPSVGNIAQAEAIVEKLGIRASLPRRYARLDEIQCVWNPAPHKSAEPSSNGVFGHLKPKGVVTPLTMETPVVTITWEKFARTVLPDAKSIELYLGGSPANYAGMCTAVDAAAPPILQWDRAEQRNPVSWYVYSGGSLPLQWGLSGGVYCPVTGITLMPPQWNNGQSSHFGKGVILLLQGAKDTRNTTGCLLPEILRSELREVRATIEAYSRSATLGGKEEASANGLMQSGDGWGAVVRVNGTTRYKLERWD